MLKINPASFKLDARSRFLAVIAASLLSIVIYYRFIYAPREVLLKNVRERHASLKEERKSLESTMPDVRSEQSRLEAMKKEYDFISSQVADAEKALPKNVNVPDILAFLSRYNEKYHVKITSIKSRRDKAQDVPLWTPPPDSKQKPISYYSILPMELEMSGSLDNIIAYIDALEKKLPYQRLGALQVDMHKTTGGEPQCFLTVLSVLGRGTEEDQSVRDLSTALEEAEKSGALEDPFHKTERPRAEEMMTGVELNGIIQKKGVPYAIINNSLHKIGDTVQNKKIIKIEKDTVMLEEEDRLFKLTIKGEK